MEVEELNEILFEGEWIDGLDVKKVNICDEGVVDLIDIVNFFDIVVVSE